MRTRQLTPEEASAFAKRRLDADNADRRAETAEADLAGRAINDFWVERRPLAEAGEVGWSDSDIADRGAA